MGKIKPQIPIWWFPLKVEFPLVVSIEGHFVDKIQRTTTTTKNFAKILRPGEVLPPGVQTNGKLIFTYIASIHITVCFCVHAHACVWGRNYRAVCGQLNGESVYSSSLFLPPRFPWSQQEQTFSIASLRPQ